MPPPVKFQRANVRNDPFNNPKHEARAAAVGSRQILRRTAEENFRATYNRIIGLQIHEEFMQMADAQLGDYDALYVALLVFGEPSHYTKNQQAG